MTVTLLVVELFLAAIIVSYRQIFMNRTDAASISLRSGIAVTPEDAPAMRARFTVVANWTSAAAFGGSLVGAVIAVVISADGFFEPPILPLTGALLGATLAVCGWLLSEARRRESAEGLTLRPQGVRFEDYVSRPVIAFTLSSIALTIGFIIFGVVVIGGSSTREGFYAHAIPIAPVLPLIALAASTVLLLGTIAAIAHRRQVARDTLGLALDDAIMSHIAVGALLQLATAPVLLAMFAFSSSLGSASEPAARTIAVFTTALFLLIAAIGLFIFDRKPERQFLRRLWPQTAAEADRLAAEHKRERHEARTRVMTGG